MAFVRKKTTRGRTYYQVVESYRVGGKKPRQKVLIHLGRYPTVDEALEGWPRDIERLRQRTAEAREKDPAPRLPGMEKRPSQSPERIERRADDLETNLERLRELRNHGEV